MLEAAGGDIDELMRQVAERQCNSSRKVIVQPLQKRTEQFDAFEVRAPRVTVLINCRTHLINDIRSAGEYLTVATIATARQKRYRRERRVFASVLAVSALLTSAVFAGIYGPACVAYWTYSPREGDILFQSLPRSRLVNAIEGASASPYSHCGIVAREHGKWVVWEAYRRVEATPLREFIFRGRNQGFAVYRFKNIHQKHIPATIAQVKTYLGRPYDARYRMDDDCIYCSELIYKAYLDASGQQLGTLVRLGDLNWRPFADTIKHYENGPVPLDLEMITPRDMAWAEQLELVFAHRIAVATP